MARVNISTLRIQIEGSTTGLASSLRDANRRIDNFARQRRNLGGLSNSMQEFQRILARTFALYGAFAAIDFAGTQLFDSVKLAADAELAEISLETLLGSAEDAKRVLRGLYDFVETTPFRLDEVRDSAQLLAAFGVETDKILPTLRSLGDIAAGINQPIRELADLYGRTLNEQRLYTRDLNQFTSRGIPLIQEFAKTFGVAENEVRGLAEAGALMADDVTDALARMTAEGGRFFDLTQRQATTTAGEWSNLLDEIDALKREFGAGMVPVLKDFVRLMRELVAGSDGGAESLKGMRESGELLASGLRVVGGIIQGIRAALTYLEAGVVAVLAGLESVYRLATGQRDQNFFGTMLEELDHIAKGYTESAGRLFDFDRELAKASSSSSKFGENLADALDTVSLEVRRAQNQLKQLTATAEGEAEKLAEKYKTPLEGFREAVEKIARARALGGLDNDVAQRALQAEVERLNIATEELKAVQSGAGAFRRGSREEIKARFTQFERQATGDGLRGVDVAGLQQIAQQAFNRINREVAQLRQAAGQPLTPADTEALRPTPAEAEARFREQEERRHKERLAAQQRMVQLLGMIAQQPSLLVTEVSGI